MLPQVLLHPSTRNVTAELGVICLIKEEEGLLASLKRHITIENMLNGSMVSILNCRRKLILHFVVSSYS
jgi:hypothetical protein